MKHPKVEFWDDERAIGNSLIVTLRQGWAFDPAAREHVRGFDTVREARAAVKGAEPCSCQECAALYPERTGNADRNAFGTPTAKD